jgi:hypothetical protein
MNEELCELRAALLSYPGVRARAPHSSLVYTKPRAAPTYFDNICQILFVAWCRSLFTSLHVPPFCFDKCDAC